MISYSAVLATPTVVSTLTNIKDHLNVTHVHHDTLIQSYIDAAVIMAENYTGRFVHTYDVTVQTAEFPTSIPLERTPVDSSTIVIKYFDSDNAEQTLAASNYDLLYRNGEPEIFFDPEVSLPSVYNRNDAIKITYSAGYTTATVPEPFDIYVKLAVTYLYEHRSDSVDSLPRFTNSVLRAYKKWG